MRATLGSFSGPMTTSATTPIRAILVRPRSIMWRYRRQCACGSGPVLFFGFDVDRGLVGHCRRRAGNPVFLALDAILEALDRLAQVGTHAADFLGAEYKHYD